MVDAKDERLDSAKMRLARVSDIVCSLDAFLALEPWDGSRVVMMIAIVMMMMMMLLLLLASHWATTTHMQVR